VTPNRSTQPQARRAAALAAGAALFLTTAAAYLPVRDAGYIWDDDSYITTNATLWTPGGLGRIWSDFRATPQYYPLVFTTFWIEYRLWGLNPLGYHAVNVVLHACSALLLWRVLRRLELPGAWVIAAVFAVHPVHVESVAWVTERKNVLSGLMYLVAAWSYLRFDPGLLRSDAPARNPAFYVPALFAFCLALVSKTVTGTLPAALLLLAWWKKGRLALRDAAPMLPMFAAAVVMSRITVATEKYHVRTVDLDLGLTFIDRVLLAGRAAWFYASKLIWPRNLAFSYEKWRIDSTAWWQWVFPAALVLVVAGLWLARHRIGRGPLAAALFFVGTLFPALGFVDVYPFRYSWVADHFQYLASIGPIAAVIAAAAIVARRIHRLAAMAPAVGLLATLAALTYAQCGIYRDQESLWTDTIRKNPTGWMAHENLGGYLARQGRFDEARFHFERAAALNPDRSRSSSHEAFAAMTAGDYSRAIELFEREQSEVGDTPFIQVNLGLCRMELGQYEAALRHFDTAIAMRAEHAPAWFHRGRLLFRLKRPIEAEAALERALQHDRTNVEAYRLIARLLAARGQLDAAAKQLDEALVVKPNDVATLHDSAMLLARRGHVSEALARARRAMTIAPQSGDAHRLLGMLLLQSGDAAAGIEALRRAAELSPTDVDARYNLAAALSAAGRTDEAVRWCREVLSIAPNDADAAALLAELSLRAVGATTRATP